MSWTYTELKAAVASYLHRSDLTSVMDTFLELAEADIRRDVRVRAMEQNTAGTLSASTLALPTRFAEARNVVLDDHPQRYVTPDEFQWLDNASATDRYTIKGENFYFLSDNSTYSIDYWQHFASLADESSNWLLTNAPDVYLNAMLRQATIYISGDPSKWENGYLRSVARLDATEKAARFPGPLVVRTEAKE